MQLRKGVQAVQVLAVLALLALAPVAVAAQPEPAGISMDQAIEKAQRQYKARVVRADVSANSGRRVYVLRLLSDEGRVWTVRIDAATGGEM
jgi:uncharacterized membrane protein YkoI